MKALLVGLAALAAVLGLGWGPVQHLRVTAGDPPSIREVVLGAAPGAPARLVPAPPGIVDSAGLLPGRARPAAPPRWRRVDVATGTADAVRPGTVTVVGPAARALPGVGAVVSAADVGLLARLPEPTRTDLVRFVVEADGAGLAVIGVGGLPGEDSRLVDRGSSRRAKAFVDSPPEVGDLVAVWAQVRPDLVAVVSRGRSTASDPGAVAVAGIDPGTRTPVREVGGPAWRRAVESVTEGELLPGLDDAAPVVSPALLAARSAAGLVDTADDGSPVLTARGAAYAVAARAAPPGSHEVPVQVAGDDGAPRVRVFRLPDGRVSVLVWNRGPARRVLLQVPVGRRVAQLRVPVAGDALTAAVVPAP